MRLSRTSAIGVLLMPLLVLIIASGCGREAAEEPERTPAEATAVPLPEWAPEDPSPEFLRAAQVLKALPLEALGGGSGNPAKEAGARRKVAILPAAWALFGSLSDQQIEGFQTTGAVRVPVKSLTTKQRAALDNWFEVFRSVNRGQYPPQFRDQEDLLVQLYKIGARQDLSNVDVGFSPEGGRVVRPQFWIRQQDGTFAHMSVGSIAEM